MTTETYKTAINVLKQKARSLDSLSEPIPNAITQFSADENKAQAIDLRAAITRLERPDVSGEMLFLVACTDLGLIAQTLGIDPNEGGAEPILHEIQAMQAKLKDRTPEIRRLTSSEIFACDHGSIPRTGEMIQDAFLKKNNNFISIDIEQLKPVMTHIGWHNIRNGEFFKLVEIPNTRRTQELIGTGELAKVYAMQGQEAKDGN